MATAGQAASAGGADGAGNGADEPIVQPASQNDLESLPAFDPTAEPTLLDHRRYWASRAGQSIRQIARQEKITEQEVTDSILLVQTDNERYSASRAGVETRKTFLRELPLIRTALDEALTATRLVGKKVVMIDKESGEEVTVEEPVERADHQVRLQAIDGVRSLLSVVQPKDPAVLINNNSQTNILNQGAGGQPAGQPGLTSPEALLRSIVQQRALTAGTRTETVPARMPTASASAATATVEGELVMARNRPLPDEEESELEGEEEESEDDSDLEDDELEGEDDD